MKRKAGRPHKFINISLIDGDGNIFKVFKTIEDTAMYLGVTRNSVFRVLRGGGRVRGYAVTAEKNIGINYEEF